MRRGRSVAGSKSGGATSIPARPPSPESARSTGISTFAQHAKGENGPVNAAGTRRGLVHRTRLGEGAAAGRSGADPPARFCPVLSSHPRDPVLCSLRCRGPTARGRAADVAHLQRGATRTGALGWHVEAVHRGGAGALHRDFVDFESCERDTQKCTSPKSIPQLKLLSYGENVVYFWRNVVHFWRYTHARLTVKWTKSQMWLAIVTGQRFVFEPDCP
jgi:hypothetical protein